MASSRGCSEWRFCSLSQGSFFTPKNERAAPDHDLESSVSICFRIAATVPICGVPPAPGFDVEKLIDEPIWAFHGRRDATVSVTVTRDVIGSFLAEAGLPAPTYPAPLTQGPQVQYDFSPLNLRYTDMSGAHGITPNVYNAALNPQLYDWMFSQSQIPEPTTFHLAVIALYASLAGRRTGRKSPSPPASPRS